MAEGSAVLGRAAHRRTPSLAGLILLLAVAPLSAQRHADTIYLDARAFGEPTLLEVTPFGELAEHRDALTGALAQINEIESLADPDGEREDGLGALNRAAGGAPIRLDPRLLSGLERALGFCRWSQGAHGPLGGNLYGLWGVRDPVYARPRRDVLQAEVEKASCGRLAVDLDAGTAQLAAGSRVDLWGFERGLAVDRAVEVLRRSGALEGWVEIGTVTRAFGPGPDDRGWPAQANPTGRDETEQRILLRDQSLAMVSDEDPIEIAGDRYPRYIDQRRGLPSRQAMAVFTVTELAIDAEGLAVTLFVVNQRLGEYRVGLLEPRPSVLWMLGSGEGIPLTVSRHWAQLENW